MSSLRVLWMPWACRRRKRLPGEVVEIWGVLWVKTALWDVSAPHLCYPAPLVSVLFQTAFLVQTEALLGEHKVLL